MGLICGLAVCFSSWYFYLNQSMTFVPLIDNLSLLESLLSLNNCNLASCTRLCSDEWSLPVTDKDSLLKSLLMASIVNPMPLHSCAIRKRSLNCGNTLNNRSIFLCFVWLVILLELLYAGFKIRYFRPFLLGVFVHIKKLLPCFVLSIVHIPDFLVNLLFLLLQVFYIFFQVFVLGK